MHVFPLPRTPNLWESDTRTRVAEQKIQVFASENRSDVYEKPFLVPPLISNCLRGL